MNSPCYCRCRCAAHRTAADRRSTCRTRTWCARSAPDGRLESLGQPVGQLAKCRVLLVFRVGLEKVGIARKARIEGDRIAVRIHEEIGVRRTRQRERQLIEERVVDLLEIALPVLAEEYPGGP